MRGIVEFELGLWWVAITSTFAAVCITAGALLGISAHRWPRLFLAGATWFIAASYWLDILTDSVVGPEMRRGGGFLLWPSLAATALTGVLFARKAATVQRRLISAVGEDGE